MGNKTPKTIFDINKIFSQSELDHLESLYVSKYAKSQDNKNKTKESAFETEKFYKDVFIHFEHQIDALLKELKINIDIDKNNPANFDHFLNLIHFLYKSNSDDVCTLTSNYYGSPYLNIIYDSIMGKKNSVESADKNGLITALSWSLTAFLTVCSELNGDLHPIDYKLETDGYHKIEFENVNASHILNKYYNLDSFICGWLRAKFLCNPSTFKFNHPMGIPIPNQKPKTITYLQYFNFCLQNPHIFGKQNAYKLYDCAESGFSLASMIYSFLGFPDPIAIFIQDFDKKTGKETVCGCYLNSQFKECYESFCGDDLSFLFTIDETGVHTYKFDSTKFNRILLINSKQSKYSKQKAGIGLGEFADEFRFWIDGDDIFRESYFQKWDTVFATGSIYEEDKHFLNVRIYYNKLGCKYRGIWLWK